MRKRTEDPRKQGKQKKARRKYWLMVNEIVIGMSLFSLIRLSLQLWRRLSLLGRLYRRKMVRTSGKADEDDQARVKIGGGN